MSSSTTYNHENFLVSFPSPHVAQVEINRPQKLNAFTHPMFSTLGEIFRKLSSDTNVRCIIISGRGDRAFTAGLDVEAASSSGPLSASSTSSNPSKDPARIAIPLRDYILDIQNTVTQVDKCTKPVICAMHGHCYGLAIDLSSACDIRLCTASAKMAVKEVDIGIAADVGTLTRLPKLGVPMSWVKDVAYSARVFSGEEAGKVGLVSEVVEGGKEQLMRKVMELANLIATKSPVAVLGTKRLIDFSRDRSVEDGLEYTAVWNSAMLQTVDVTKAMRSGLTKKNPTFEKL